MVKQYNERFSAQRYEKKKQKVERYFNFLKQPVAMDIQEKLHHIFSYEESV